MSVAALSGRNADFGTWGVSPTKMPESIARPRSGARCAAARHSHPMPSSPAHRGAYQELRLSCTRRATAWSSSSPRTHSARFACVAQCVGTVDQDFNGGTCCAVDSLFFARLREFTTARARTTPPEVRGRHRVPPRLARGAGRIRVVAARALIAARGLRGVVLPDEFLRNGAASLSSRARLRGRARLAAQVRQDDRAMTHFSSGCRVPISRTP